MSENPQVANVESIWKQFSKPLLSFIKRRVSNEQDAEDILQNVFCKIHNNISSLRETEKIHAWVYTITRNSITDFHRTQRFERNSSELSEDIPDESEELDATTANEDMAKCLKVMIRYLPEKYKEAIILTEFQNLTQKELGERLGLSVPGAKSRVQRARAKLKEMLLNCCHLEFDRQGNVVDYKNKNNGCKFC